jgi:hypothetical protein
MQVNLAPLRRPTKKMSVPFPKAGVLLLDESGLSDHECDPFFGCFLFRIRLLSEETARIILQQVRENAKDATCKRR